MRIATTHFQTHDLSLPTFGASFMSAVIAWFAQTLSVLSRLMTSLTLPDDLCLSSLRSPVPRSFHSFPSRSNLRVDGRQCQHSEIDVYVQLSLSWHSPEQFCSPVNVQDCPIRFDRIRAGGPSAGSSPWHQTSFHAHLEQLILAFLSRRCLDLVLELYDGLKVRVILALCGRRAKCWLLLLLRLL